MDLHAFKLGRHETKPCVVYLLVKHLVGTLASMQKKNLNQAKDLLGGFNKSHTSGSRDVLCKKSTLMTISTNPNAKPSYWVRYERLYFAEVLVCKISYALWFALIHSKLCSLLDTHIRSKNI